MYFSTNSRYVLHRAQWMTPSAYILKGAEKLLSVKVPNDDPTKPALRVNIPGDTSHSDNRSKLIHNSSVNGKNFNEPRSRSLVSRPRNPSLHSSFKDGIMPKSESETQLSQLEAEDFLIESSFNKEPSDRSVESYATQANSQTSDLGNFNVAARNEDDYHEGLSTPLHDPATGEALANSYVNNPAFGSTASATNDLTVVDAKQPVVSVKGQNKECSNSRTLYIIVDSPEESEEKCQSPKSVADSCKEEEKGFSPLAEGDSQAAVKALPQKRVATLKPYKSKSAWQISETEAHRKSKNLPKISAFKSDEKQSMRKFDVQELEDVATYILHSRQNKDGRNKSYGIECVPEKEFTTRSESVKYNEAPIKVPGGAGKSFKGLANEVAPVEELPDFVKLSESRRKQKHRSSDPWGRRKDKPKTSSPSQSALPARKALDGDKPLVKPTVDDSSQQAELSNSEPALEYPHGPVAAAGEEKSSFYDFESAATTPAFKMPAQVAESKRDESTHGEAAAAVDASANTELHERSPVSYSHSADEAKPEYNLIKVEVEPADVGPSQSEYFSPWKDNSSSYSNASKAPCNDWVEPKPTPSKETPSKKMAPTKHKRTNRKHSKLADSKAAPAKVEDQSSGHGKSEKSASDGTDFKTSGSFVSISCDKIPSAPTKFSAAFPPLLCEALKIRGRILGFRREFLFGDKWTGRFDFSGKHVEKSQKSSQDKIDLSENSILFPKAETEKFECPLFGGKKNIPVPKTNDADGEKSPKIGDNIANVANERLTETKGPASVDSLAMMKKVKEIVEFDLENAIKIFKKVERSAETPSVVMLEGNKWKVDTKALEMYVQLRKGDPTASDDTTSAEIIPRQENVLGDEKNDLKIRDVTKQLPKYLPPRRESEYQMKLSGSQTDSVIAFNPQTSEFFVNSEALASAVRRRADESFDDVIIQTLEGQLTKGAGNESIVMFDARDSLTYQTKSGDSILVFDEETQTWKVDYSILEKREQQLRMEEELMKRSELILETFEKLESGKMTNISKPETREKKIFDYSKEEWKAYPSEKKSKEKASKSKHPFKESNAEEIRRSNSDLYENLFVGSKKETTENKNSGNSQSGKGSKSCSSREEKMASGSGSAGRKEPPDSSKSESKLPPAGKDGGKPTEPNREDDNFWESFLKMNILPRDISEISKIRQPPAPAPAKTPLQAPKTEAPKPLIPPKKIEDPKPTVPPKKIEEPKPSTPPKKIEEPRFRIHLPFIGDKKTPSPKIKDPPNDIPKKEEPQKKPPEAPPSAGSVADVEIKIKTPANEAPIITEPKKKAPEPTIGGATKQDTKIKVPSKETPKVEDPKKKPPEPTFGNVTKQESKVQVPGKEAPKIGDPKAKPQEVPPPTSTGDSKQSGDVKAPPPTTTSPKDPKTNKPPPTIGASKSSPTLEVPAVRVPSGSPVATKIQDPKTSSPGKKDKSAADHYVSENIVEISRNTNKDIPSKFKSNKIETVKLNITSEKRMPSKVTEINLNKKCEEKGKEPNAVLQRPNPVTDSKKPSDVPSAKNEKSIKENKTFYKNFEKYKTPFSDPEYEEKSMKIKSDMESNPNLKKLDNWNKTLVLHDIGKQPENIETWLKDETDKMATLLLKVLQEAADGKPRKKPSLTKIKPSDKPTPKGTPYDTAQKKCETVPESFLFRVRTVNLALENDKKINATDDRKAYQKPKDAPGHLEKGRKSYKVIDPTKLFSGKEAPQQRTTTAAVKTCMEIDKPKLSQTALESVEPAAVSKELQFQNMLPLEIVEEVPGPEFLKKLSNTWKVFPIIGSQMTIFTLLRAFQLANLKNSFFTSLSPEKSRADAFTKLFTKYGPIVNVQGPLTGNVILIHKPEHLSSVFEQDAFLSVRSICDSLDYTRRETEDKILSAAICTDWSKPEWNDLKRGTNDPMLKGCDKFLESAEAAGDSLVSSIRKTRNMQNCVSEDFMDEIKRWSLEGLCSAMFEKSFGFLERKNSNMSWILEPDKLYMAIEDATNCLNKCEKGFQTWRLMNTPSSLGLGQAYRSLSAILSKQLYQAEINLKSKNELLKERSPLLSEDLTFLESMLLNDGLTTEEITCNLVDILLMGTNMMSCALGFLLYDLAQNVKVQNKLLKELQTALPTKSSGLYYQNLHSLKYLQACLKESLRLHIPVPLFCRMLQNDILLSNYIIPKGTYVVMDYRVTCMKEQIFDDPEKFAPERWMTEEKWMKDIHPFDTFPLCHGPRAELAKKVVEMQLKACVAKVVRNFGIEYHYGEIEGTNSLISFPDKPLKLNFVERDS